MEMKWETVDCNQPYCKQVHWMCEMPASTEYGIYRNDKQYNIEYELIDNKNDFTVYKTVRTTEEVLIEKNCLVKCKTIKEIFAAVSQDYVNHMIVHTIDKYATGQEIYNWQYNAHGEHIAL